MVTRPCGPWTLFLQSPRLALPAGRPARPPSRNIAMTIVARAFGLARTEPVEADLFELPGGADQRLAPCWCAHARAAKKTDRTQSPQESWRNRIAYRLRTNPGSRPARRRCRRDR